jgi:hypothetical protein
MANPQSIDEANLNDESSIDGGDPSVPLYDERKKSAAEDDEDKTPAQGTAPVDSL